MKATKGISQEVFEKVLCPGGEHSCIPENKNTEQSQNAKYSFACHFSLKQLVGSKMHWLIREILHPEVSGVPVLTLCSSRTQLRTWRQASTPSSSRGRCNGKSTIEKRELSGRAKVSGRLSSWGKTSTSTRLWPATGTGERSNRYTQDSISLRSASSWLPFSSTDSAPVNTRHMVSLGRT